MKSILENFSGCFENVINVDGYNINLVKGMQLV